MLLEVPYYSQMNNSATYGYQPYQQCNVTSLAMAAGKYLYPNGVDNSGREEALLSTVVNQGGSPYVPEDLARGFNAHYPSLVDEYHSDFHIDDIVAELNRGRPCVVHGYFTRSGHIVCIVGHDDEYFVVHDPYGEWFRTGYNCNGPTNQTKGKHNRFKMTTIEQLCDFSGIWTHVIKQRIRNDT